MTTATVTATQSHQSYCNIDEIFKFARISLIWISIIFGAVWLASYAVGELLPAIIIGLAGEHNIIAQNSAAILKLLTPLVAVMVFIPINATYMVLAERRGLALLTVRMGPNRVGPDGFLQTGADAVKLLFKENIDPEGCDTLMFTLAPIIFFAPSVFGAIPLLAAVTGHPLFQILNLPTGIFYVLAMSSIPTVGIVMGGWASNNKYSLVGGLRSAAQAISYEIPLVLAVVSVCLIVGTLNVVDIAWLQNPMNLAQIAPGSDGLAHWDSLHVDSHLFKSIRELGVDSLGNWGFFNWNIMGGDSVSSYLALVTAGKIHGFTAVFKGIAAALLVLCSWLMCGLYMLGACAEINRIPFDLPEAESELVSGYNTEYSGIRFAIFFLAEFTNLFIVATIAVVIWFGGGASPFPAPLYSHVIDAFNAVAEGAYGIHGINWLLAQVKAPPILNGTILSGVLWSVAKVYFIVYFAILVRGTLPRFRIDQLMDFGWKRLIPLSLILLLAITYLKELI